MLTSLYRDGPLRQRIRKGYVIVARRPDDAAADIARRRPAGRGWSVRFDERSPTSVWVDTGFVCLHSPQSRAAVARRLADGVVALAAAARQARATLLPSAQLTDGPPAAGWLCADLHALEVLGDVQREISTNLLRQHSPLLIALTGRAAFGSGAGGSVGSRRLADATDQLTTRYIHSFAPAHLARVKESLSRDEGVARLDLMDVNPLSEPGSAVDSIELRLCDAQILVATTMAQALLSQALTIRARRLVREGNRVGATPQGLLDKNRSQAVVRGLSASLIPDLPSGASDRRSTPLIAGEVALRLLKDLIPEFRALDATFDELSPLVLGLSLEAAGVGAVRNENDLLHFWRRHDPRALEPATMAARLREGPAWLLTDQLSAANHRTAPGAASVVAMHWTRWLAGEHGAEGAARPGGKRPQTRKSGAARDTQRGEHARRQTFDILAAALEDHAAEGPTSAGKLLRAYLADGGGRDLDRELQRLDRERAKQIRRKLRPPRAQAVAGGSLPLAWEDGEPARALDLARRHGHALLSVDVTATERNALSARARDRLRDCPDRVGAVLLTNTLYRSEGGQRAKVELVIILLGEETSS